MMSLLVGLFSLLLIQGLNENPLLDIHAARKDGNNNKALYLLRQIETIHPDQFELNNLGYLKSHLLINSGLVEKGIKLLDSLNWRDSLLGDFILLALLENTPAFLEDRQRSKLIDFLQSYPRHPSWSRWALTYANLLKKDTNLDQALIWYDRVWRSGSKFYARIAALEHARLHLTKDNQAEAIKDLLNLIKKNTKDDVALQAVLDLETLLPNSKSSESGIHQRVNILMRNRHTTLARKNLAYLVEHFPKSSFNARYLYLIGRSYVLDGQFDKAYLAYSQCYEDFPSSDLGIFCKYQSGNTALRKMNYATAVQEYQEFLSVHVKNKRAPRVLYHLSDSYRWLNQDSKAEKTALKGLEMTKGHHPKKFHYYLARLYIEKKRFKEALQELSNLDKLRSKSLPSGVTREEIQYFKGVALTHIGQNEKAQAAFRSGSEGRLNYFGYLCRDQLLSKPKNISAKTRWDPPTLKPRPFFKDQQKEHYQSSSLSVARIQELLFLGFPDEAALEIRRAGPSSFSDRDTYLYNLAYFSDKGKLPREAIQSAELLFNSRFREHSPDQLPVSVQKLLYPRHYWPIIEKEAHVNNIDPYLLLAIIYQESRFDSHAKSSASARGLMQFLLAPARILAEELGISVPNSSDLYNPELSIRLGAYHMKKLLLRHGNSIAKALAAYNGGSSNATRWGQKGNQEKTELYIANIGFRETKLYVLKVLGNYRIYRDLYDPLEVKESVNHN